MVGLQYLTEEDEVRLVSEMLCSSYSDSKKHFVLSYFHHWIFQKSCLF